MIRVRDVATVDGQDVVLYLRSTMKLSVAKRAKKERKITDEIDALRVCTSAQRLLHRVMPVVK